MKKVYIPTEYEQMLIFAGWVHIEELDPNYKDYVKRCIAVEFDDYLDHDAWVQTCQKWDELDKQFKALEQKHGIGRVWTVAEDEANRLCDEMAELESYLVY